MNRKTFKILTQMYDKKTEGLSREDKIEIIYEEYRKLVTEKQKNNNRIQPHRADPK